MKKGILKKGDFIVFGMVILISVVCFFVFTFSGTSGKKIKVTVNNTPFASYPLEHDGKYQIKTEFGTNTLVIENGSAHFSDSDCRDKTCEKMGKIGKEGQSIICLPHKIVVEVVE